MLQKRKTFSFAVVLNPLPWSGILQKQKIPNSESLSYVLWICFDDCLHPFEESQKEASDTSMLENAYHNFFSFQCRAINPKAGPIGLYLLALPISFFCFVFFWWQWPSVMEHGVPKTKKFLCSWNWNCWIWDPYVWMNSAASGVFLSHRYATVPTEKALLHWSPTQFQRFRQRFETETCVVCVIPPLPHAWDFESCGSLWWCRDETRRQGNPPPPHLTMMQSPLAHCDAFPSPQGTICLEVVLTLHRHHQTSPSDRMPSGHHQGPARLVWGRGCLPVTHHHKTPFLARGGVSRQHYKSPFLSRGKGCLPWHVTRRLHWLEEQLSRPMEMRVEVAWKVSPPGVWGGGQLAVEASSQQTVDLEDLDQDVNFFITQKVNLIYKLLDLCQFTSGWLTCPSSRF